MVLQQLFPALDIQPGDLNEIEKNSLLDFEKGATKIVDTNLIDRLKKFGLVAHQDGRWGLTDRGRRFCRVYGSRGAPSGG